MTNDYWEYAKFRFAQRIASSCISVFATQQMLTAVGLGARVNALRPGGVELGAQGWVGEVR